MQYEPQLLTLPIGKGRKKTVQVEGMVALGTGLAYHRCLGDPDSVYDITHLASGACLASEHVATSEREARYWLERVAPLLDWTLPWEALKEQMRERFGSKEEILRAIEDALQEAREAVEQAERQEHPLFASSSGEKEEQEK